MALAHFQRTFTDTAGNVQAGIEVTIRNESTGALAAIYEDSDGNTAKDNPFTTDSFGYGDFYAADGRYRIQATGIDWRDEEVLTFENLQAAVDDAESFAQAAAMNAGIYADTSEGLAATSDGEYFSTPAAGSDEYLTLYLNDAGSAVEIDTYPNKQAIDDVLTSLASNLTSEGSDLVAHTGTDDTVTEALDKRTIYVGSEQTFLIPTDYPDLQSAIDELSGKYKDQSGAKITLTIESGHTITSVLLLENGDFSNFVLSSEDSEVTVSSADIAMQPSGNPEFFHTPVLGIVNAVGPKVSTIFDLDLPNEDVSGLECVGGSCFIDPGCGFTGGYERNCIARGSRLFAKSTVWTDSNFRAVSILDGSVGSFFGADCSRPGGSSTESPARCMMVANGSYCDWRQGIGDDSEAQSGVALQGSVLSALEASMQNAGQFACYAGQSSLLNAKEAILSSTEENAFVSGGGQINLNGATYSSTNQFINAVTADGIIFADVENNQFTGTLTGVSTTINSSIRYSVNGNVVTLYENNDATGFQGDSNSSSCSITGIPQNLRPEHDRGPSSVQVRDGGSAKGGFARVLSNGTIQLYLADTVGSAAFDTSGEKGLTRPLNISYVL